MGFAVAAAIAILATVAMVAESMAEEKKTYRYSCKGGLFTITAAVDRAGADQWRKTEPVILQIGDEPPQTLVADPDAPEANSYKNKDYEFYALGKFVTLTHKSHGTVVKFYSGCRVVI